MLVVTKANSRSTVHRPGYIDYIGVKRYKDGVVIGEHRFLGLFTSTAYSARVAEMPLLRGKVKEVAARSGLAPGSHLGKALAHILETYPRDELFQITDDELFEIAIGILQLGERQRFRLFVRRDPFERFVSCLIFVPRENYTTELRRRSRDPDRGVRRHDRRFRRAAVRCRARAHPYHRAHDAGQGARRSIGVQSRRNWPMRRAAGTTSCATR